MGLYFEINLWAVLVAAIASQALGMLWYSKLLFANSWTKAMDYSKKDETKLGEGAAKSYLASFIASLITAYILAYFIQLAGAVNSKTAAMLGLILWLGFCAMPMLSSVLFEKKNLTVYLIGAFYYLASIIIMAIILSAWHFGL